MMDEIGGAYKKSPSQLQKNCRERGWMRRQLIVIC